MELQSSRHKSLVQCSIVELVGRVLGLPIAAVQIKIVAERAVGGDLLAADAGRLLRHEVPAGLRARAGQQIREGRADRRFVRDLVCAVPGQFLIVPLDVLMGGFEMVGECHRADLSGLRATHSQRQ